MWRPCNFTPIHSLTGPVGQPFASCLGGQRFASPGCTNSQWNRVSPVSDVSLNWWPWRYWSLWPCLRWASSRNVIKLLCWQCDNPTWSHTALLSQFHARCRSSFWLHNQHSRLLGGSPVESLQSHCIHTHSSIGPVVQLFASCYEGHGSIPRGVLLWNQDSPVSTVLLHWWIFIGVV